MALFCEHIWRVSIKICLNLKRITLQNVVILYTFGFLPTCSVDRSLSWFVYFEKQSTCWRWYLVWKKTSIKVPFKVWKILKLPDRSDEKKKRGKEIWHWFSSFWCQDPTVENAGCHCIQKPFSKSLYCADNKHISTVQKEKSIMLHKWVHEELPMAASYRVFK